MKKIILSFLTLTYGLIITFCAFGSSTSTPESITLYNEVTFYDMYRKQIDAPVPEGLVRLNNSRYTMRLSAAQLTKLQSTLSMEVNVKAACDNYDRLGSVQLVLAPKGRASYSRKNVQRLELGRFVTPFMNKNIQPDSVPFRFNLDHMLPVLQNMALLSSHDFWVEFEIGGNTGRGRKQVEGCEGRFDTFQGTVMFHSDRSRARKNLDALLPLGTRVRLNNYDAKATDTIGSTHKTFELALEKDIRNAQLVLISSNHGANRGGEEYSRRNHIVSFDEQVVHQYTPGRESCEHFRKYNTQGNGIYSRKPRSSKEWQSFSNWCPGDVIDTRIIPLGDVKAGSHKIVIDVPDAVFVDKKGNIPVSLFVQGRSE